MDESVRLPVRQRQRRQQQQRRRGRRRRQRRRPWLQHGLHALTRCASESRLADALAIRSAQATAGAVPRALMACHGKRAADAIEASVAGADSIRQTGSVPCAVVSAHVWHRTAACFASEALITHTAPTPVASATPRAVGWAGLHLKRCDRKSAIIVSGANHSKVRRKRAESKAFALSCRVWTGSAFYLQWHGAVFTAISCGAQAATGSSARPVTRTEGRARTAGSRRRRTNRRQPYPHWRGGCALVREYDPYSPEGRIFGTCNLESPCASFYP